MVTRFLTFAGPFCVYASVAILACGLFRQRKRWDWIALLPAVLALSGSLLFVAARHQLFFDEDIYIAMASNLSRAPLARIPLLGSPDELEIATYFKEPPGWPVLLSLVFLMAGSSEAIAFLAARVIFGAAVAAVYCLAREFLTDRRRSAIAAIAFAAAPVCFQFSASPGTDTAAALMTILGMWGLASGNPALAVGGFALAAQTRMELMALLPLLWLSATISNRWKGLSAVLLIVQAIHVQWVLSISPVLARAEQIPAAFSTSYILRNAKETMAYLFNPATFPVSLVLLGLVGIFLHVRSRTDSRRWLAPGAFGLLFYVYLLFYAGSFSANPRYVIPFLAPLVIAAASLLKRPAHTAAFFLAFGLPYLVPAKVPRSVVELSADHDAAVEFAAQVQTGDLVVSTTPPLFFNRGLRTMDASLASLQKTLVEQQLQKRPRVWYHAGLRTNQPGTVESLADNSLRSQFQMRLVSIKKVNGTAISFYEIDAGASP